MYQMPVKAIKNIVRKEIDSLLEGAINGVNGHEGLRYYNDATKNIFHAGYDAAIKRLDACSTHEKLDDFIGEFYRMSLEEWINSL